MALGTLFYRFRPDFAGAATAQKRHPCALFEAQQACGYEKTMTIKMPKNRFVLFALALTLSQVVHAKSEQTPPKPIKDRILQEIAHPIRSCKAFLALQNDVKGIANHCAPYRCNENVFLTLENLQWAHRRDPKVLVIAPLSAFDDLATSLRTRDGEPVSWGFHAIVLYKGMAMDVEDEFANKPLLHYMEDMFTGHPSKIGIWAVSPDEYRKAKFKNGWLYPFKIISKRPTFVWADLLNKNDPILKRYPGSQYNPLSRLTPKSSVKIRYWEVPGLDLASGIRKCVKGTLQTLNGHELEILVGDQTISVPYLSIDGIGLNEMPIVPFKMYKGWWDYKPASDEPCQP